MTRTTVSSIVPRVTQILTIGMLYHLSGFGQQTGLARALIVKNQLDATISGQLMTENSINEKEKGEIASKKKVRIPIKRVALNQSQVSALHGLRQREATTVAPSGTEFLQVDSQSIDGETSTIDSDHVTMPLKNYSNYGYVGEFYLGSGEYQKIRILLDTGSANSWISDFDPNKSTPATFHEPDDEHKQNVKITFGSGYLQGYFVDDQVTIGDISEDASDSDRLVIANYTFGMVTEQTCFQDSFDAIIGMAYPEFAEPGITPFFDEMMYEGILGFDIFAFHMSMNPDEEESEVMFGDFNPEKIDHRRNNGEIEWHDVEHKLFWSINLEDVKIKGKSLGMCSEEDPCLFTPDTGTSLLTMPSWAAHKFKEDHPEWGVETGCDSEFTYGDLTYVINGIEYPIPSHHWMERTIDDSVAEGGTCKHKIGTLDVGQQGLDKLFIGGDSFMQIYYSIFDRANDAVGFTLAKHTAPEIVNHYDSNGYYHDTLEITEECYTDPYVCYDD